MLAVMDSLGVLLGWLVRLQWWGVGLRFSCGVVCGRDLFPPLLYGGRVGVLSGAPMGAWCAPVGAYEPVCIPALPCAWCACVHKRPNLCTCSPVCTPPRSCGCVRVRARWRPYNILSPPETFLSNFYGSGVMTRVVSTDVPNRYPYNKTPPDKRRVFLVAVIREACEKF